MLCQVNWTPRGLDLVSSTATQPFDVSAGNKGTNDVPTVPADCGKFPSLLQWLSDRICINPSTGLLHQTVCWLSEILIIIITAVVIRSWLFQLCMFKMCWHIYTILQFWNRSQNIGHVSRSPILPFVYMVIWQPCKHRHSESINKKTAIWLTRH